MDNTELLNSLKEILSNLYSQLGLTEDIIKLSQVIDILIMENMSNNN